MSLWQGGDYALMALILAVSILFPAVKLLLLLFAAMARDREGMALPGLVHVDWQMSVRMAVGSSSPVIL